MVRGRDDESPPIESASGSQAGDKSLGPRASHVHRIHQDHQADCGLDWEAIAPTAKLTSFERSLLLLVWAEGIPTTGAHVHLGHTPASVQAALKQITRKFRQHGVGLAALDPAILNSRRPLYRDRRRSGWSWELHALDQALHGHHDPGESVVAEFQSKLPRNSVQNQRFCPL